MTDNLISLAGQASDKPDKRELDVLLATGEQTTAALMAMILKSRGYKAKSFLGFQAGIHTDQTPGKARILDIDAQKVKQALDQGHICVVAGFQGRMTTATSPPWDGRIRHLRRGHCRIFKSGCM